MLLIATKARKIVRFINVAPLSDAVLQCAGEGLSAAFMKPRSVKSV